MAPSAFSRPVSCPIPCPIPRPVPCPVPDFDRKVVIVLSHVPSKCWQAVPAHPVPCQDFELVPLSLCPGTMKELLSLCPKKLYCPVMLETLVYTAWFLILKLLELVNSSISILVGNSNSGLSNIITTVPFVIFIILTRSWHQKTKPQNYQFTNSRI